MTPLQRLQAQPPLAEYLRAEVFGEEALLRTIPPGITWCSFCGDFRGATRAKFLNHWNNHNPEEILPTSSP